MTRFTVRQTHDRKEIMGIAPTGREMSSKSIEIHRIEGGKIVEQWALGTLGLKLRGQRLEQEIRERERIEQELEVARSIQRASLPEEIPELEGWKISPRYQPAREVGGDFYGFHLLSLRVGGSSRRGRNRQGSASSVGLGHYLRNAAGCLPSRRLLLSGGGT